MLYVVHVLNVVSRKPTSASVEQMVLGNPIVLTVLQYVLYLSVEFHLTQQWELKWIASECYWLRERRKRLAGEQLW